jgi:hypothetical protein
VLVLALAVEDVVVARGNVELVVVADTTETTTTPAIPPPPGRPWILQ